jgi:hypothetical protein
MCYTLTKSFHKKLTCHVACVKMKKKFDINNKATSTKTIIGRNSICGALKRACSTKLFLWRMQFNAPQNFWRFCGAFVACAPQKVAILWRMWTGAP